jgi:hypothetical protein
MSIHFQTVPLFSRRRFAFSTLGPGEALEWVMARAAEVEYGDATLLVRVHEATVENQSRVVVQVRTTAPTCEDPATDFVSSKILASATVDASVDAKALLADSLTGDLGGYVQVNVRGERNGASDTVFAVLSAELIVREGSTIKPRIRGDFTLDSPDATLTVGNAEGAPRVRVMSADDEPGRLLMGRASAPEAGEISYDHDYDVWSWVVDGATRMRLGSGALRPESDGALDLGTTDERWDVVHARRVDIGEPDSSPVGSVLNLEDTDDWHVHLTMQGIFGGVLNFGWSNNPTEGEFGYTGILPGFEWRTEDASRMWMLNNTLRPAAAGTTPMDLGTQFNTGRWRNAFMNECNVRTQAGFSTAQSRHRTTAGQLSGISGGTWHTIETLEVLPANGRIVMLDVFVSARNPSSAGTGNYKAFWNRGMRARVSSGTITNINLVDFNSGTGTWADFIFFRVHNDGNNVVLQVQSQFTAGTQSVRYAAFWTQLMHGSQSS